jgi:hypothetical protein
MKLIEATLTIVMIILSTAITEARLRGKHDARVNRDIYDNRMESQTIITTRDLYVDNEMDENYETWETELDIDDDYIISTLTPTEEEGEFELESDDDDDEMVQDDEFDRETFAPSEEIEISDDDNEADDIYGPSWETVPYFDDDYTTPSSEVPDPEDEATFVPSDVTTETPSDEVTKESSDELTVIPSDIETKTLSNDYIS